jgi:uncharacterized RDD family membrane protein YckC
MSQLEQPTTSHWQAPVPQPGTAAGVAYAGFWIRVVAWIIDGIAIGILTSALSPILGAGPMVGIDGSNVSVDYSSNALGGLVGLAYFVGLWTWKGQTIGMMPFNLWVVSVDDGIRPDLVRSFLRYVGLIISFAVLLLGVIWVAFDARKQGWHDKVAQTLVIRR